MASESPFDPEFTGHPVSALPTESERRAVDAISAYLTTGMHHSTTDAKAVLAQIIATAHAAERTETVKRSFQLGLVELRRLLDEREAALVKRSNELANARIQLNKDKLAFTRVMRMVEEAKAKRSLRPLNVKLNPPAD